jgi:hypothetical protein
MVTPAITKVIGWQLRLEEYRENMLQSSDNQNILANLFIIPGYKWLTYMLRN